MDGSHTGAREDDRDPHVIVTAYGNDGQHFTQLYSATEPGDWESLTLAKQDRAVQAFSEGLRETFDAAVTKAIELEERYH